MALKKDDIIQEALTLLDENGLEGVTLRKLASRLNVQAPALYWHFKNKAALINDMAEAILQEEFAELPPRSDYEPWQEWLKEVLNRLRKAMLARRDGGRIVAGAHLSLVMAKINEAAIDTLFRSGISLRKSRLIVLTAAHYTFGFVIEEQTAPPSEGVEAFDLEHFKKDHPTMIAAITEYFESGRTADDLFNDGLQLIIKGK
ncbi:TetR family transcriptional regulator [Terrilactibacillus sp. S3-3]|nr:TetR family transcriptional regulator [Terrilactibacillus sp. S3-3]